MLIGLSGKIGTGKSHLPNLFLEAHPEYIKLGFADVLKKECSEIYGYPNEWNYTEKGKAEVIIRNNLPKIGMKVREILQWHGTDLRRAENENYWVKKMQKVCLDIYMKEPLESGTPNVIIDDVRFLNEVKWVKAMGGLLIRIEPYPEWKPGPFAEHRSETELDNYNGFNGIIVPEYGELKLHLPFIEKLIKGKS